MSSKANSSTSRLEESESDRAACILSASSLSALAEQFGTPLYVYDQRELEASTKRLQAAVSPFARVFYSVKANPHRAILANMRRLNCGVEVASGGELSAALEQRFLVRDIAFAGPGKTTVDLESAIEHRVASINVDSPTELGRIGEICERYDTTCNVALRLSFEGKAGPLRRRWHHPQPFGMDPSSLEQSLDLLRKNSRIQCVGIHSHFASDVLDGETMARLIESVMARAMSLRNRIEIKTINLGGGFGIPHYADDRPLELDFVERSLQALAVKYNALRSGEVQLIVESGRYLIGTCGYYLCRVVDVKSNDGIRFAVLDGGVHQNLFQSSAFRFVRRPVEVMVCRESTTTRCVPMEVVGRLCTPIDRLGSRVSLPEDLVPGEIVAFRNAGAYSKYASPLTFLGHDWPAEVLVEDSSARLIARRISLAELMKLQTTPAEWE